jgi:hypothetical protein
MNWYRKCIFAYASGEFWIQNGTATGADGDINDTNHEGEAIMSAQAEIMDGEGDWDEWKQSVAKEEYNLAMQSAQTPEEKQQIEQKWNADNGEEFLMEALRQRNVDNDLYLMAEGWGDVRKFAMKRWGWKRLASDNVETWTLTASDLRDIANGLWDAYGEEAESETFNIYCYATNKWYNEIPFEVISKENPTALNSYIRF